MFSGQYRRGSNASTRVGKPADANASLRSDPRRRRNAPRHSTSNHLLWSTARWRIPEPSSMAEGEVAIGLEMFGVTVGQADLFVMLSRFSPSSSSSLRDSHARFPPNSSSTTANSRSASCRAAVAALRLAGPPPGSRKGPRRELDRSKRGPCVMSPWCPG